MTIALWSMLAILGITYGCGILAKTSQRGYNNNNPREFSKKLEGRAAMAMGAHQNHLESLPFYFAAVVLATAIGVTGGSPTHLAMLAKVDQLAMLFVAIRLVYTALYLTGKGSLRSLVWTAGVAVNVMILMAPF